MQVVLRKSLDAIWQKLRNNGRELEETNTGPIIPADLVEEVEKAHQEWLNAKAYFEQVSDPELVDHAIHWITASEKKYMYLMNRARSIICGNGGNE